MPWSINCENQRWMLPKKPAFMESSLAEYVPMPAVSPSQLAMAGWGWSVLAGEGGSNAGSSGIALWRSDRTSGRT